MLSRPAMNSIKQQVSKLLSDISGVRALGFGWDHSGNQVLNVDIDAQTDSALVERRLTDVEAPVRVRKVSGSISASLVPSKDKVR